MTNRRTDALITALTRQMDGLRDLACRMMNADHPEKAALEHHAEELYGAAACIESWIAGLLASEEKRKPAQRRVSRVSR